MAGQSYYNPMSGHYMPPAPPPVYGEGMGRNYYSSEYDPRYWRRSLTAGAVIAAAPVFIIS